MTRQIKAGSTDVSVVIRIVDSGDGTPETGVVYNTSGLDLEYRREGAASVDITEATLAALTTAHADGGFLHIGNGYYRLDLPDAAVAAGATGVLIHGTCTGMVVIGEYIELVAYDPYDAVRMGLTALPNAAAEAAGGLFTRGTGAGQINQAANGRIDANTIAVSGTTQTARDLGASVLLSPGTGTGQVSLSSGAVTVGTNNDKTGYGLSAAAVQAIWDALTSALTTVGSVGKLIVDYLDAAISSRLASASYTAPLDAAGTRSAVGLASANLDTQLNNQLALLGYIDANATTILGDVANLSGRIPTALVGGRMDANVGAISGDVTAADNTEAFFDGTGYAGTNNVIPTVTTLTNAPSDSSGVTTLLSRLTATRAGYLDNLSAGAAALEASVQSVLSKLLKYVQLMVRKDAAIATDNATELTAINANGGSGAGAYDNTTDATEAIRDRGDAAWTTGAGGANPAVLQNTTIATLASQTSFTLTAGSADDNAYNGHLIVVTDQTTAEQKAVGVVLDYVGSTKTVTLAENPGIFTMAVGDEVDILVGKANMVAIDGALTNGNNATLNLKQLNIVNSAGTALVASSTGSSGHGISATGNGVGEGISAVGGSADGYGISAAGQGLASGIIAHSPAGPGFQALGGTNSPGIDAVGAGSGAGMRATGGPNGHGIEAKGGITSGDGINAAAQTSGDGMQLAGAGGGLDLNATTTDSLEVVSSGDLTTQQVRDAMKLAPSGGAAAGGSIDDLIATVEANTQNILDDTGTDIPALIAALNDLSSGEVGDAVLDEVVEGALTLRQILRVSLAALANKVAGGGTTTITFRDLADSKARITATVDANGNRTAVTLDGS